MEVLAEEDGGLSSASKMVVGQPVLFGFGVECLHMVLACDDSGVGSTDFIGSYSMWRYFPRFDPVLIFHV